MTGKDIDEAWKTWQSVRGIIPERIRDREHYEQWYKIDWPASRGAETKYVRARLVELNERLKTLSSQCAAFYDFVMKLFYANEWKIEIEKKNDTKTT